MDAASVNANAPIRSATSLQPSAPEQSGATGLSSDFETFLKMLTVQMENQDPLNPIQSSDFAVQLATFSGVEQQVRTNELLQSLTSDRTLTGLADMAGWVGQEVLAPVSAAYEGSPVELFIDILPGADQATLTVRDEAGSVVTQIAMPPDTDSFFWDGTDADGAPVAPGKYSFAVDARAGDEFLGSVVPETYATVREVRIEEGSPVLVIGESEVVMVEEVSGIRSAEGA